MQYARPSRMLWVALVLGACGESGMPVSSPDGSPAPPADAALPADGGAPPDLAPGPDLPPAPPTPDALPPVSACPVADTAPLRRLTITQYQRTVRDLTGVTVTTSFPAAESVEGFDDRVEVQNNSILLVTTWYQAAEEIVAALAPRLPEVAGCPAGIDEACARQFIGSFGQRAYRRPLTAVEVDAHLSVFTQVRALGDGSDGVAAVLRVMLQSPHFLYRPELAGRAGAGRLSPSPWEVASRLSYFLWGTMPDAPLFAAAEANQLASVEQLSGQVQRMLTDLRARQGTNDFFRQWLGFDDVLASSKDAAVYPAFNPALAAAMREEGYRFTQHVVFEGDARVSTLFTSTEGIVNAPLAQLYGVSITGTDWQSVDLSGKNRLGLLTQSWFLAARSGPDESGPAFRGVFLRDRLLCQPVPPPPPGLDPPPVPLPPGSTTRERYQAQLRNPACAACHQLFDPLGFPFESYDGIGAFRATDSGKPVDASAVISGTDDLDGPVNSAPDLLRKLGGSSMVRDCLAMRWYQLAIGRESDQSSDCRTSEVKRLFRGGSGDLRALLATIAVDAARRARPAEEVASALSSPLLVGPGQLSMQKLVLDLVSSQVVQLKQRLTLPLDRMHLDQHLEGLRDLERRLQ